MSGAFGMELKDAMVYMQKCMDVSHPLLADELQHMIIDRNLNPADNDSSPQALMQHLLQSQCFDAECTWVWALARLLLHLRVRAAQMISNLVPAL